MVTLEKLKKESEQYFDTLVLSPLGYVVRLDDVIEDDDDLCFVFEHDGMIVNSTAIMGFIPLKGFIRDSDYNSLANIWNLQCDVIRKVNLIPETK